MNYRGALEINLQVREQDRRLQLLTLERTAAARPRRIQTHDLRIRLARALRDLALRVDPAAQLSRQGEAA
jgi:hypothetical protein